MERHWYELSLKSLVVRKKSIITHIVFLEAFKMPNKIYTQIAWLAAIPIGEEMHINKGTLLQKKVYKAEKIHSPSPSPWISINVLVR